MHALLFDLRCFGASACPGRATDDVAAVGELRRRGARRITLVGASMGGAIAVVAAARLRAAAVVDLSGERYTTGLTPGIDADASAAAPHVHAPALFAVARGDRYVSPVDMRAIAHRLRSPTARLIVLPAAAGHGWDVLRHRQAVVSAGRHGREVRPPSRPLVRGCCLHRYLGTRVGAAVGIEGPVS